MDQDKEFLGKAPVGRLLAKLAIPAVVAQLVNLLYNMVDRIYIGRYDATGLALTGVGVCLPVIMMISAFACLVGMGGAPQASIFMGKREYEKAEKTMGNCFSLLLILSAALTVGLSLFAQPILLTFGASQSTIGPAMEYMNLYVLGTVFVQISLGMNAFISAQGFTTVSMLSVLIGAVLNIILDPIFIFTLHMGVEGAALATVLSQAVSALWIVRFLLGKRRFCGFKKSICGSSGRILRRVWPWGVSPFIMQITQSALNVLEHVAFKIRRRHRRGRHDGAGDGDAVLHAASAGAVPGGPAYHQLQLRRPAAGAGQKVLPAAACVLSGVYGGVVELRDAVS